MPDGVVLPSYPSPGGRAIAFSLDHLARHASGLPRLIPPGGSSLSRERMIEQLRSSTLVFAPGTQFLYSNLGFAVLSLAMERAYGEPIEDLLPEKIAAPLGMKDTTFRMDALPANRILQGYDNRGELAPQENSTWPAYDGAGALRSTPNDMQHFLKYNMGLEGSPSLSRLAPMMRRWKTLPVHDADRQATVGWAWQQGQLPGGVPVIWKDGAVPGFSAYVGFTLQPRAAGVVVLASQRGCAVIRLSRCILEALDSLDHDAYCSDAGRTPQSGEESDEAPE
jgi:serine-type D-Ala-D-Ala carboxypeptidase/endopeptidase